MQRLGCLPAPPQDPAWQPETGAVTQLPVVFAAGSARSAPAGAPGLMGHPIALEASRTSATGPE